MRVTLVSTTKIVEVNNVEARVWEGTTDYGIPVHAFITRIAVERTQDASQFERELQECRAPSAKVDVAYPLRMVL